MTVRLPEELDAQLEALAAARHTSKHALLIEGVSMLVDASQRTARVTGIAADVRERYAELMRRLEDA
ncbi:ribbon-helix-helix protein, CopG family [Microbacterium sp. X-17]